MLGKEWLTKYESKKELLRCKIDLDVYFTENKIGKMNLDVLNIGKVSFPTGKIIACDPLIELEDAQLICKIFLMEIIMYIFLLH